MYYAYRATSRVSSSISTINRLKQASRIALLAAFFLTPVVCTAQKLNRALEPDQSASPISVTSEKDQAQGNRKGKISEQLAALAKEAIETQNDILVSGEIERSLAKRPMAALFREGVASHYESLLRRKKALSEKKNDYKSHKTQVTVNSVTFNGDRATVVATEYVKLALDPDIGGPTHTEYVQDHILEYLRDGVSWKLISDSIPLVPALPESISVPIIAPPTSEAPENYFPEMGVQTDGRWKGAVSFVNANYAATYSKYSGTQAAAYALTYWGPSTSNYNSQYRRYSANDCTNFISQALKYGGWPYDKSGSRTGDNTWYYGSLTATTSYSWAGAHNFLLFQYQSGRGYFARYFQDLVRGDVLQADFGPTPNGTIDHTMMVTKKDSNGTIYLTYHSSNTKNRSITDIRAAYPGSNWYGEKMYSSF